MAITDVRIHPAIGVARVGNSPDEFFIGPERPREKPTPEDGFKDNECRIKRQAARFRVFATYDDGSVEELTADDADIEWTVHLANKKAAERTQPGTAADLTIDPGSRGLDGPNDCVLFDSGAITFQGASPVSVPLGEIRTDTDGRLIVLGGYGTSDSPTGTTITSFYDNTGWYDDVSDGPVTASVTIQSSGETFDADGAWVIVGPPKFAPELDNVITLYDRLYDLMAQQGLVSPTTTPSYTEHIYPFLERARHAGWVTEPADLDTHDGSFQYNAGSWTEPVYDAQARNYIFSRLRSPSGSGDMPLLAGSARLPDTQYGLMEQWKNDNFQRDWAGPPDVPTEVTPDGMDEAALENCVGAAFFPGIEAGGITGNPILTASNYTAPFRLDHASLAAGDVTRFMALPWQADFKACGTNWWPIPRPNDVTPQSGATDVAWDRDVLDMNEMVTKWSSLGFVVEQGDSYVEVDRCDTSFITLLTPGLAFTDVPQGPMGMARTTGWAIKFEVRSTDGPVTLKVPAGGQPSHPRLTAIDTSVTVGPTTGNAVETARLWVTYTTGPVNETISDTVTVENAGGSETWTVDVTASTAAREKVSTALVLDRSGSMSEDRGDGQSKHRSLQEAAKIFVDAMVQDDGVALVRYNQDSQELQGVTSLGPPGSFDPARDQTKQVIDGPGLNPSGRTSIGDGIHVGRTSLDAASGYDVEALVVLTDGIENESRYIADVAADIDERTYSVGLGQPNNTSAPALQSISGNHGGYLLVTGEIDRDNRFILEKYFLQILAGISNAEVVLDPDGELTRGTEHRIPFELTDADTGVDVILLSPRVDRIDFRVQTPNGAIIEPWRAEAEPEMRWVLSEGVSYYRLSLPVEVWRERFEDYGQWHALLRIGRPQTEPDERDYEELDEFGGFDEFDGRDRPDERDLRQAYRFESDPSDFSFAESSGELQSAAGRRGEGLPYSLLVHAYSDLRMDARLQQAGFEPGDELQLTASLTEADIPVEDASVQVKVTRPDDTSDAVTLEATDGGQYRSVVQTTVPGVYSLGVEARGRTRRGVPFQRERVLTGAVWHGGSRDAEGAARGGGPDARRRERDRQLCETFECLFDEDGAFGAEFEDRMAEYGVDIGALRKCVQYYCRRVERDQGPETARTAEERPVRPVARPDVEEQLRDLLEGLDFEP